MTYNEYEIINGWLEYWREWVSKYHENCEREYDRTPCGTIRMERTKARLLDQFIDYQKSELDKLL